MEGALVPPALGWVVVFGVFYGKREAKKTAGGWRERNTRGRGGEERKKQQNETEERVGEPARKKNRERQGKRERQVERER